MDRVFDEQQITKMLRALMQDEPDMGRDDVLNQVVDKLRLAKTAPTVQQLSLLLESLDEKYHEKDDFDYDNIVEQSFPASDPPPPLG